MEDSSRVLGNNALIHRILIANELISLDVHCGLRLLGWATHLKMSCMFASCAVFIRFMMITKGDNIRMSSDSLRQNQASLKKIILILLILLSTCTVWIYGISLVNWICYHIESMYEQICLDTLIKNDKSSREKFKKSWLVNMAILFVLLLFCSYNQFRVNRYMRGHGRSYFIHRRQNIITFCQLVSATNIYIISHVMDSFLMFSIRYIFTSPTSQEYFRHFLHIYYFSETVGLTALLPLSWLISAWKNLPEFSTKEVSSIQRSAEVNSEIWKKEVLFIKRPPQVNSELGFIQKSLKPRGPYLYDQDLSQLHKSAKSKDSHVPATFVYIRKPRVYGRYNSFRSTKAPLLSKCVYWSEASDNNHSSFQSTPSTLFYTSKVKKMPRSECSRQASINVIHVKGHPTPDLEDEFSDVVNMSLKQDNTYHI